MAWGEKMRRLFRDRRGSSSRRNPSLRLLLREGDSSPFGEEDLPDTGLPVEQSSGKSDLVVVESPGNSNQHVDERPKPLAAGDDYRRPIKLTCVADPEVIAQMVKLPLSGGVSKGPSQEFDLSRPHAGAPSTGNLSSPRAVGSRSTELNLSPPEGGSRCTESLAGDIPCTESPLADVGGLCTKSTGADVGGPSTGNLSSPRAVGSRSTEFNLSPPEGGGRCTESLAGDSPCTESPLADVGGLCTKSTGADVGGPCTELPVADGGGRCTKFNLSLPSADGLSFDKPMSRQEFLEMSQQEILETLKHYFSGLADGLDSSGRHRELPPCADNGGPFTESPLAGDGPCTVSPVADGGGPCTELNLSHPSADGLSFDKLMSQQEFRELYGKERAEMSVLVKHSFSGLGSNGPSTEFNTGPYHSKPAPLRQKTYNYRQLEPSSSGVPLPDGISSHLIKNSFVVSTDDQYRAAPTKSIQVRAALTDDHVSAAPTDKPDGTAPTDEPAGTVPNKTIQDIWNGTHDINARGVTGDSDFVHHPLSYTWGIHNTNLFFMAVGLLVLLMMIRSTEPPTDADAIWKNSLNVGYGFVILTLCLSRTLGSAVALVLAISYGPFIAWAVHSHSGPIFGRAVVHLTTAWAAGCFGYSMAIYRLSVGSLQVDRVAHIEWYSRRSKEQNGILDVYCCLMVTIPTLFLVIPVIWIIKNMTWMKANDFVLALTALTMITTIMLYLWYIPLVFKTAIVSLDTMFRLMVVFLASFAPSFVVAIFGRVLLLYYFSVLMMMMAVMFGYALAANQHRKCSASGLLLEVKDGTVGRTGSTLS